MPLHQYDPKNVKLVFGAVLVEGYAEGSFVNVEYNEDLFSLQIGSDGESSRSKSNNRSARITVNLMPGAAANIGLGAALAADKAAGAGVFPLALTDLSTGSSFIAEGAWIVRDPGYDFQTEAQARQWIFETDNLEAVYGAAV